MLISCARLDLISLRPLQPQLQSAGLALTDFDRSIIEPRLTEATLIAALFDTLRELGRNDADNLWIQESPPGPAEQRGLARLDRRSAGR
jgi:hypothetical protein